MSRDVEIWLENLGLSQYAESFKNNSIEWDLLPDLDQEFLNALGVTIVGHQIRIIKAATALVSEQSAELAASAQEQNNSVIAANLADAESQAERRQISVMFCDLVGSTSLSDSVDPEDLRQILDTYYHAVTAICESYTGFVARIMGDGVLTYFGYPKADENDAERSVRAGLEIVQAVRNLETTQGIQLSCRIGIATGSVVLAEVGKHTAAIEISVMGVTPNLAARLQSEAKGDCLVISDVTRGLIGDRFALRDMGWLAIKGLPNTRAWEVLHQASHGLRYSRKKGSDTNFIGRAGELAMLNERWQLSRSSQCQSILVSGEAGIGKSRLCQEFIHGITSQHNDVISLELQCSQFFSASPLYPIKQYLRGECGIQSGDEAPIRKQKCQTWLAQVSPQMLKLDGLERFTSLFNVNVDTAQNQTVRDSTETLLELLTNSIATKSILIFVEDVHWIDSITEEFLELAQKRLANSPAMLLLTGRPEYTSPWRNETPPDRIPVSNLPTGKAQEFVKNLMIGHNISKKQIEQIVSRSDGVPLYIEEVGRAVLESENSNETLLPATLQDSLMARLDRLGDAKKIAQAASVIGRQFTQNMVLIVTNSTPEVLENGLNSLVAANLVTCQKHESDNHYMFRHALIRDAAYSSMVREVKQPYHRTIANTLLDQETNGEPVVAELVAHHLQESGDHRRAAMYWELAADNQFSVGADKEAAAHYRAALSSLDKISDISDAEHKRVQLKVSLGSCLLNTEGYGSEATHKFWDEMIAHMFDESEAEDQFRLLMGLSPTLYSRGQFKKHLELFDSFDQTFLAKANKGVILAYHGLRAVPLFLMGHPQKAWFELKDCIADIDISRLEHSDLLAGGKVFIPPMAYAARSLVILGDFELALILAEKNVQLARSAEHPPSLCWALQALVDTRMHWEDVAVLDSITDEYASIAESLGLVTRLALATLHQGQKRILDGNDIEGGAKLAWKGLKSWEQLGGIFHCSERSLYLANNLINRGRQDLAVYFLDYAKEIQENSDERIGLSEIHRMRGRIALEEGVPNAIENIIFALNHSSKSGELLFAIRAACDLTEFSVSKKDRKQYRSALRLLCNKTKGGTDFPDMIRAYKLLRESE